MPRKKEGPTSDQPSNALPGGTEDKKGFFRTVFSYFKKTPQQEELEKQNSNLTPKTPAGESNFDSV
jgi:hypothetical protein